MVYIVNLATSSKGVSTVPCNTRALQCLSPMYWTPLKLTERLLENAKSVLKIRFAKPVLILILEIAPLATMASTHLQAALVQAATTRHMCLAYLGAVNHRVLASCAQIIMGS